MTSIKLKLPPTEEKHLPPIEGKTSVVLIGANGSGKTRMSVWIEKNNENFNVHRISAQKSLNMPTITRPSDLDTSMANLLRGNVDKSNLAGKYYYRWKMKPETYLLDDFSQLMEVLVTEEYEKSLQYRKEHKSGNNNFDNTTYLELLKRIWEDVIVNKILCIEAGKVEASSINFPRACW